MPSRRDPWKQCADLLRREVRRNPDRSSGGHMHYDPAHGWRDFEINDMYADRVKRVLNSLPFAASIALEEYLKATDYHYEVREFGPVHGTYTATVYTSKRVPKHLLDMLGNSGWKRTGPNGAFHHSLKIR